MSLTRNWYLKYIKNIKRVNQEMAKYDRKLGKDINSFFLQTKYHGQ